MDILKELNAIADNIENKLDFNNLSSLCEIAASELSKVSDITLEEIINLELPAQFDNQNKFSEPPITLVDREHFVIDLYSWKNQNTNIHSHSFAGAFKNIKGYSLQKVYTLEEFSNEDIQSQLEIEKEKTNLIRPGDIQIIKPGMDFLHEVFHLDNINITLTIRTKKPLTKQFNFYRNGFLYNSQLEVDSHLYKKMYFASTHELKIIPDLTQLELIYFYNHFENLQDILKEQILEFSWGESFLRSHAHEGNYYSDSKIKLNESALEVLELLSSKYSLENIVNSFEDEYEVTRDECLEDIEQTISFFKGHKLLRNFTEHLCH